MILHTATRIPSRPDMDPADAWNAKARHFRVTLRRIDQSGKTLARMSVYYSQGSAHTESPTLADVLTSLRSDATAPASFADFCSECGYDQDSRKAEKTWKACRSIAVRMRKLLGVGGVYLLKDGEPVQAGHPNMLLGGMHRTHSFSWWHALRHEGYSIEVPA